MQALIIADDLTGALDSAAALAAVGLRTLVARRPSDLPAALVQAPDALAVSTASREGSEAAARAAVGAVFDALAGRAPRILFKKVDSRLKGHPGAEAAETAARAGLIRGLAAPAIPDQGRVTRGGRVEGAGVAQPIDIAAVLAGSGLALEIPDAQTDADLDRALAQVLDGALDRAPDRGPTLLIGAAGLSAALARRLRPGARPAPVTALPGPILLAIGSHDPITLAQAAALEASGRAAAFAAPDGHVPPLPAAPATLLRLTATDEPFRADIAGPRFAAGVARAFAASQAATLLACGGETADAILGALGVGVLAVQGEVLPGVPVSVLTLDGRALRLVTKSGGFGDAAALVSVVDAAAGFVQDPAEEAAR